MRLASILLFALLSLAGFTQQQSYPDNLVGRVVDAQGEPVMYAAVAVYNTADTTLIKGTATDLEGKFGMQMWPPGSYLLKVRFLSMEDLWVPNVEIGQFIQDLGDLTLEPAALDLDGVEIAAERSYMELELDKKVFHVGQDVSSNGATASQVLEQVPTVQTDVDGNVSLRGSGNVRILVDGKPIDFGGGDATTILKTIPGNSIEKVELITSPSARYDASGEVGIINLVLKEDRRKGLTGSVGAWGAHPIGYGGWSNLGYRLGKWNFTAGGGYNDDRETGGGGMSVKFLTDSVYSFDNERTHERNGMNYNGNVGVEYQFTKKVQMSLSGSYKQGAKDNWVKTVYTDYNGQEERTGGAARDLVQDENWSRANLNWNFLHTYDKIGREWSASARASFNEELRSSLIAETNEDPSAAVLNQSSFSNREGLFIQAQTDYVHPVDSSAKWEVGAKVTWRDNSNDFGVSQLYENAYVALDNFTNTTQYTEGVYAGYLMGSKQLKKVGVQGGLRAEYSDVNTIYHTQGFNNPRQYLSLFPSAHATYKLPKRASVQAGYSRRIQRPEFWWMLPFFDFPDSRSLFTGSPDLNPVFTNSYEVNYMKNYDKGNVNFTSYYRKSNNIISWLQQLDTANFVRTYPVNIGHEHNGGAELGGQWMPTAWFMMRGNLNGYYSQKTGTFDGQELTAQALQWGGFLWARVVLPQQIKVQTTFWGRAPHNDVQGRSGGMAGWNMSASKSFWNEQGTLSLNVRDILNSTKFRRETYMPSFESIGWFQWNSRTIKLTFTYIINPEAAKQHKGRSLLKNQDQDDFGGGR